MDKTLLAQGLNAKYIDLSRFTSVEAAVDRGKHCLTYIQKNLEPRPRKWGKSSCNLSVVHPLQMDNKLPYQHRFFRVEELGVNLGMHPFYRLKLQHDKKIIIGTYHIKYFKEVRVEAIIV